MKNFLSKKCEFDKFRQQPNLHTAERGLQNLYSYFATGKDESSRFFSFAAIHGDCTGITVGGKVAEWREFVEGLGLQRGWKYCRRGEDEDRKEVEG